MEPINWYALTPEQRDEVIHEKVMGLTIEIEKCEHYLGAFEMICPSCKARWEEYEPHRPHQHGKSVPRYSQSMDAAWLALEKMKEAKWSRFCIKLDGVITQHKRDGWDESTGNPYVTWFQKFVKLLNADGICVAALRTMGYTVLTEESRLTELTHIAEDAGEYD